MNLLHLKYVIEVAKAGSISKAASNLYMNQPHLSKTIKDLEESMQIIIFERTSKGVIPTKKGQEFIERAKQIIIQVDEMEAMYRGYDDKSIHLDIYVPRASYIAKAFTDYLSKLDFVGKDVKINYKETNSFDTVKAVYEGDANIGIVRFLEGEENYFFNLFKNKELEYKKLYTFEYQLLISSDNPLVEQENIYLSDLKEQIEIAHGDIRLATLANGHNDTTCNQKKITIYERCSQFELLNRLPSTYMWVSPVPVEICNRYNLVAKKCLDKKIISYDYLITRKDYRLLREDKEIIEKIWQSTCKI